MFSLKNEKPKTKLILFLILGLFLALCFLSFFIHGNETLLGDFETMNNDDVKYLRSAWTLLETGQYTYKNPEVPTVFIMPGLTTVLAAFVALFGQYPILPFKIFQALLGACSLYMVFLIARKYFSERAALITTFMGAIYFPNIYVTNVLLTEQIFSFLFALLVLIVYYAISEKKLTYYILGGITLGLMALFRPTILLFPVVVLILWIIHKYKIIEMVKYALIVIGIVCALLAPWIIRNYLTFDRFIPLTISSGNPFLQGTFINYDQSVREIENIDYEALIREEGVLDYDKFGKDEIVTDEVETWIGKYRIKNIMTKEPLKYLYWYTIGKTIENWKGTFLWINLFNLPNSLGLVISVIEHYIFIIFAVIGIIQLKRKRKLKGMYWLPILSILYFNFAHLPFYAFPRYVYPVMFCVMLFSGYAVDSLLNKRSKFKTL